jgi:hypothetical protein
MKPATPPQRQQQKPQTPEEKKREEERQKREQQKPPGELRLNRPSGSMIPQEFTLELVQNRTGWISSRQFAGNFTWPA